MCILCVYIYTSIHIYIRASICTYIYIRVYEQTELCRRHNATRNTTHDPAETREATLSPRDCAFCVTLEPRSSFVVNERESDQPGNQPYECSSVLPPVCVKWCGENLVRGNRGANLEHKYEDEEGSAVPCAQASPFGESRALG